MFFNRNAGVCFGFDLFCCRGGAEGRESGSGCGGRCRASCDSGSGGSGGRAERGAPGRRQVKQGRAGRRAAPHPPPGPRWSRPSRAPCPARLRAALPRQRGGGWRPAGPRAAPLLGGGGRARGDGADSALVSQARGGGGGGGSTGRAPAMADVSAAPRGGRDAGGGCWRGWVGRCRGRAGPGLTGRCLGPGREPWGRPVRSQSRE